MKNENLEFMVKDINYKVFSNVNLKAEYKIIYLKNKEI